MISPVANQSDSSFDDSDLSKQHETPTSESISTSTLKDRIKHHYELASDYYYSLWGEHVHHGYFLEPADTKERAQLRLIELLIDRAQLEKGTAILDVGCGLGGTSRYLAKHYECNVTGVTISGKQVEMATKLTLEQGGTDGAKGIAGESVSLGSGSVCFIELDAETLGGYFTKTPKGIFDCVWISEAMSHLPNKQLFFRNAVQLLKPAGKLVVADWFKAEVLTDAQFESDIKPIEGIVPIPMLIYPCTCGYLTG
ncbi:MAG: hypothetical protein Q9216_005541 [Gyalolechia sp. 2 TL-2023]